MTTISAREFNQDVSAAKRAALQGPVTITDRGEPAFVLLTVAEYRKLAGQDRPIADWLMMGPDIDFEPEKLSDTARSLELP